MLLALQRSNKELLDDLEAMKAIVQSKYNRVEEVTEHAKEELALTTLIRSGADRDLVQAKNTIEDLTGKLATTTVNWNALWQSFHSVVDLLQTSANNGKSWGQFVPLIPARFQQFIKKCVQVCTRNVLAQAWVLALAVPLVKLAEDAKSQEYLDAVEKAEPKVDELAGKSVTP
jgi:myosin-crossreactive antigen